LAIATSAALEPFGEHGFDAGMVRPSGEMVI
jgi:hypothetical protein